MKKLLLTGACTALVTPFLGDRVNYPMLEQLIRRQTEAGIDAIVLFGTTGEAPTLSDAEKLEMVQRAKAFAGDSCKIIAGTGSNCTAHAAALSKEAEAAGADGLLVVSPYYNKATAEGLYRHYEAVARAVSIPLILYNVPSRTGVDIPVSVYRRLARIPNIVGVKEAARDLGKVVETIGTCGPDFSVWSGNDDLTVPVMALGGRGVISVTSNVAPVQVNAMAQAALLGDYVSASAIQLRLRELNEILFCEVNPIPVKAAMKCIGYDCGGCRLPLTDLSPENLRRLERILSD